MSNPIYYRAQIDVREGPLFDPSYILEVPDPWIPDPPGLITRVPHPWSPWKLKRYWELLDADVVPLKQYKGPFALLDLIQWLRRHRPWHTVHIMRRWVPMTAVRAYELREEWDVMIDAEGMFAHRDRRGR